MNDNQKSAVLGAIASVREPCQNPAETMRRACAHFGATPPAMSEGSFRVTPTTTTLSESPTTMTVLHAAAHLVTSRAFPAHGAEFCANLLRVTRSLEPYQAEMLRHEFDARGVHYTPDHRRRAVIKAVVQRASDGTRVVEAIFDDPPEHVEGPMTWDSKTRRVMGQPLDRLRYLSRVS